MKTLAARTLLLLLAGLIIQIFVPAFASAEGNGSPDVTFRISRLEPVLQLVQEMETALSGPTTQSPSAMLESMLFGTDWIDPDRAIVFGMNFDQKNPATGPAITALVPFKRKNDNFKMAYQAIERTGYYLVPLPQSKNTIVEETLENSLIEAMKKPGDRLLSIEVCPDRMLKKADSQIQQMLSRLDQQMAEMKPATERAGALTQEDVKKLFKNLLDIGDQIEMFSAGLDLTDSDLVVFFQSLARPETEIAEMMKGDETSAPSVLGNYLPAAGYQMKIRTLPLNNLELLDFFNQRFGEIYQSIGIDINNFKELVRFFSGEMAGGFTVQPSGIEMEMVAPLKSGADVPPDFLQKIYIPWLIAYGKSMAETFQKQTPDNKLASFFSNSSGSVIDGTTVVGVAGKIPVGIGPDSKGDMDFLAINLRLAVSGDYLLMTSDDNRMKRLLSVVKNYKPAPAAGPLMKTTLDIDAVIRNFARMAVPDKDPAALPNFGKLVYSVDVKDRALTAEYAINIRNIRSLIGYVSQNMPAEPGGTQKTSFNSPPVSTAANPHQPEADNGRDAAFWFEKGALYATYGNGAAAVKSFQKAINIDPEYAEAYFNMGVVYGEMGDYRKALDAVEYAIESRPENGRYYYGRGWIYMRSGNPEMAMTDIRKAAGLGDPEAKKYLEKIAPRES